MRGREDASHRVQTIQFHSFAQKALPIHAQSPPPIQITPPHFSRSIPLSYHEPRHFLLGTPSAQLLIKDRTYPRLAQPYLRY